MSGFNSNGIQVLVIPVKGWSKHGWFFTSSSQLYSLKATTQPCLRCVGKDGRGAEGAMVQGAALCCSRNRLTCSMCAAWHWKEGCWDKEFCWLPSSFADLQHVWYLLFPPPTLLCWGNCVSCLPLFRDLLSAGVNGSLLSPLPSWHSELSVLSVDEHTSQMTFFFPFFNYFFFSLHSLSGITVVVLFSMTATQ